MHDNIKAELEKPTTSLAVAAKVFGIGMAAAYRAVQRGEIPTVGVGKKKRVPTSFIRKQIGIETAIEGSFQP